MITKNKTSLEIQSYISSFRGQIISEYEVMKIVKMLTGLREYEITTEIIDFTLKTTNIKKHVFEFPHERITRYVLGEANKYTIFNSIRFNSYLSHQTALFFNELTNAESKLIFLNYELSSQKPRLEKITQEEIDSAFERNARITNNFAKYEKYTIYLLNSKNSKKLGIISKIYQDIELLITNTERTLIDIVVRPFYGGGLKNIINIYKVARQKVDIIKLVEMLQKLNFIYPYHQTIGFIMEKSGVYSQKDLARLKELGIDYNFYIIHGVQRKNLKYSLEWKIFYPKYL
jgi:predicted transcriptional regulator of viral defense system